MRRRDKTGDKRPRRRFKTSKRQNRLKARDRDETLEQLAATSEVLEAISRSTFDLQIVLATLVKSAGRLCQAENVQIFLYDGEFYRIAADNGFSPEYLQYARDHPIRPGRDTLVARTALGVEPVQIPDALVDPEYTYGGQKLGGYRTLLGVPLLRDEKCIGVIALTRSKVHPFTDRQVALVTNFAAQAVIAIENARLLNELRESLERQTATADVLRVISSSPGELEPVFQAMLEKAVSICDAKFGTLFRFDGSAFQMAARVNTPAALAEFQKQRGPFLPPSGSNLDRMMKTKQVQHSADDTAEPVPAQGARLGGARSIVHVPMLQGEQLVGALVIYRQEVRAFTEKQIELLKNFAAQAVIAIDNARLLTELRQRTADLSESLEQQTATSEVLKVISSSPGELNSVFESILSNATQICEATYGNLLLRENGGFRRAAQCNAPQELIEEFRRNPIFVPLPNNPLDRVLKTKETVHTVDAQAESNLGILANARTLLNVPMLSHNELVGTISIYRQEVRPFTDKQIELVQNFAAQAVIAIENARLLNELRGSLERQTATSEVLGVISKSPGDLEPVYQAILQNATRICEAKFGVLNLHENGTLRMGAMHNVPIAFAEWLQGQRGAYKPIEGSLPDRVMRTKQVSYTADNAAEATPGRAATLGGARSTVTVPMLKAEELIGTITIYRQEVRPFTDKQIDLLQNFAAQAVIAIENARLLNDLNKLNQQLEQRVSDQVGEIERMGRLRRFLPPQVADLIVASGTEKQLESHRREITALFCDLRGFTGFSESSDPEDVMALLAEYHAAIGTIINKYSGTLERYAGDGVMVIFNDPVPVENPALQAVLMALEMRTAIEALMGKWRLIGHDIGFGIGIAHGFATLGTIGFEGRRDYAAIGTVSNVASRLCDEAKPGQILISPRVLLAVEKAVTVEPVGEFALKGIRRPMLAYNVLESLQSKPN